MTRAVFAVPIECVCAKDDTTATGIRVHISADSLPSMDDPFALNRADGFSRASPFVTAFVGNDADPRGTGWDGSAASLSAQVGADDYGKPVPLRFVVETAQGRAADRESFCLRIHWFRRAAADYVAVVLMIFRLRPIPSSQGLDGPMSRLVLGRRKRKKRLLAAYHAPTRRLLQRAGIAPNRGAARGTLRRDRNRMRKRHCGPCVMACWPR